MPPGDKSEGTNYVAFLALLKNLLPGKSVSIAAPASYWYLKGFPIDKISKIVDYIVFMTYDLHGQWDAENSNAQIGCDDGMCLRSHVNLTETMTSLAMVTKAGADSGKIVVGVSSYGRSFKMASAGCDGPTCKYTGGRLSSNAKKGECTDTAGYISNAEINDLINESSRVINARSLNNTVFENGTSGLITKRVSRVNKQYVDTKSHSNILVYDDTEWVAYMSAEIREKRAGLYKGLNMGGSVNWATDLEEFKDPPDGVKSWKDLKLQVKAGNTPVRHAGGRNGNWTTLTCEDPYFKETVDYTPAHRWAKLDASEAWIDLIADWKKFRDDNDGAPPTSFGRFISYLVGGPEKTDCQLVQSNNNCRAPQPCRDFNDDKKTGPPAASFIWNSLVQVSSVCNVRIIGVPHIVLQDRQLM